MTPLDGEGETYTALTDINGVATFEVPLGGYALTEVLSLDQAKRYTPQEGFDIFCACDCDNNQNPVPAVTQVENCVITRTFTNTPKSEPELERAEYVVEHYRRDNTSDPYSLIESDIKAGIIGSLTNAQAKSYLGYAHSSFTQEIIAADGSTVVKIYYDKIYEEPEETYVPPYQPPYPPEPQPEPEPEPIPVKPIPEMRPEPKSEPIIPTAPPELPEEEVVEELVPEAEPVAEAAPELDPEVEEEEVIEEEVIVVEPLPQAEPVATLPKTGAASPLMTSGFGTLLLAAGLFLRRKRR